jgi:GT2 family glycosyltransferase
LLSIVIVSYNTSELTINCLKSIYSETKRIDFEIIVVDNNSDDDTVSKIKTLYPLVKIVENIDNRGFAYALNVGIKHSSGDVVLSINSDTIIINHAIEKSYNFLIEHTEFQILGVKLLNADGSLQPSCRYLPSIGNCLSEAFFLTSIFPRSKVFGKYYMSYFNHDSTLQVEWIKGTYMMIRKEVFEKIGLFDDNYFLYSEETDFMLRAKRGGFKTVFYHDAEIYHLEGASSRKNPEKVYKMVHKTKLFFFRINYKFPERSLFVIIQHLAMLNRVIAYFVYGLIGFKPEYLKKSYHFLKAMM